MTFSLISELIRQFIRVYDLELSGGDHGDTHLLPERLATCRQVHPDATRDIGISRTKHVCADFVMNQDVRLAKWESGAAFVRREVTEIVRSPGGHGFKFWPGVSAGTGGSSVPLTST